jgi:hypothetical protein
MAGQRWALGKAGKISREETYCPAAAWSKATKLSLSSFCVLRLSDLDDDGMLGFMG